MIRAAVATEVVDVIGRKWAVEVAEKLESGPRRYNELLKEVGDQITPKVFTRVLRRLEAENIIQREVVHLSPPGVQYQLTAFGSTLLAALDDLARLWAQRHERHPTAQRQQDQPASSAAAMSRASPTTSEAAS
jgi:DNA-binding HxlR family transcriptional regulator